MTRARPPRWWILFARSYETQQGIRRTKLDVHGLRNEWDAERWVGDRRLLGMFATEDAAKAVRRQMQAAS